MQSQAVTCDDEPVRFPGPAADRGDASARRHSDTPDDSDDKVSLFWKLCGATILSIVAMFMISAYNLLAGSIQEVRGELNRLGESRGQFVKGEDFTQKYTQIENRLQDIQTQSVQPVRESNTALAERVRQLEDSSKRLAAEAKEAHAALTATLTGVREAVSSLGGRLKAGEEAQHDLQAARAALSAVQEKVAAREAQAKLLDDERRTLTAQVQEVRERLAKVEGVTSTRTASKVAAPNADARQGTVVVPVSGTVVPDDDRR